MKSIRFALAGVVLLLSVAWAQGQDNLPPVQPVPKVPPVPPVPPQPFPALQPFVPGGDLLSAKGIDKLEFTKEQKADYDKLADEYKKKQKELQEKLLDLMKSPDPNAIRDHLDAQRKLRPDYLTKVEKLLTDEQKKTFATVRNEFPGININVPPFPVAPFHPFGPSVGPQFLPAQAQKQLKLTDDQKKKVDELQKELESKIMGLLTDEQKKAFDDMKKRPGGFGPGIGFPPPPPPPPPPNIDLPKLPPPPGLDKKANPTPPPVEPGRVPEVKKIDK